MYSLLFIEFLSLQRYSIATSFTAMHQHCYCRSDPLGRTFDVAFLTHTTVYQLTKQYRISMNHRQICHNTDCAIHKMNRDVNGAVSIGKRRKKRSVRFKRCRRERLRNRTRCSTQNSYWWKPCKLSWMINRLVWSSPTQISWSRFRCFSSLVPICLRDPLTLPRIQLKDGASVAPGYRTP